jgi:hypothetical protein
MRPKAKVRREPSERTRNLRHGTVQTATEEPSHGPEESAKARVTKAVSDLALRTASASGQQQRAGVHKRGTKLSAKQQRRKQQQRERGIAFEAKVDVKADAYKRSQESIKQRASGWEEINDRAEEEKTETQASFLVLQEEMRLQKEEELAASAGEQSAGVQGNAVAMVPEAAKDHDEEEEEL